MLKVRVNGSELRVKRFLPFGTWRLLIAVMREVPGTEGGRGQAGMGQ